jgi:hypothetical protein
MTAEEIINLKAEVKNIMNFSDAKYIYSSFNGENPTIDKLNEITQESKYSKFKIMFKEFEINIRFSVHETTYIDLKYNSYKYSDFIDFFNVLKIAVVKYQNFSSILFDLERMQLKKHLRTDIINNVIT